VRGILGFSIPRELDIKLRTCRAGNVSGDICMQHYTNHRRTTVSFRILRSLGLFLVLWTSAAFCTSQAKAVFSGRITLSLDTNGEDGQGTNFVDMAKAFSGQGLAIVGGCCQ